MVYLIVVSGILISVSILLIGIYIILTIEHARGIGQRFRYTQTLMRYLDKTQKDSVNSIDSFFMSQMGLRNPPNQKNRKTGLTMMSFSFLLFLFSVITQQSLLLTIVCILGMILGFINPYILARSQEKKFEENIEKEVVEMFEIFNFYLTSGATLEDALDLTSDNIGANLTPYMKRMVNNLLLQSKESAIERFADELNFNQNVSIFSSALKQAIKGYSDTLQDFVSMQTKLSVQLKNEEIERVIMQMPTKFSMVSAILIITMIVFLVVPVFTNVFSGMNVFVNF